MQDNQNISLQGSVYTLEFLQMELIDQFRTTGLELMESKETVCAALRQKSGQNTKKEFSQTKKKQNRLKRSNISINILNWKRSYAQLEACICSMKKPRMLTKVCTCSTENMHMLKCTCAHALLRACTCSSLGMCMLNLKCAHAQV